MKTMLRRRVIGWAAIAAVATACAGPLQRGQVAADAAWWVHLDLDQFKQSQVGQFVMGELEKPEAQAKFAAFQAVFNFDPRRNVRGGTLYGVGADREDAVLILQGSFDTERLLTLARAAAGYETSVYRGYTIHSYREKSSGEAANRTHAVLHPAGLVLFGRRAERVWSALDVIDGLTPSLVTSAEFTSWAGPTDQAFLLAAARRAEGVGMDPRAEFLKQCTEYSLACGESAGNLFADTLLTTDQEETASKVLAITQGLKALLSLKTDDPSAAKIAQGISLAQSGSVVMVSLRLAVSDVLAALESKAAERALQ